MKSYGTTAKMQLLLEYAAHRDDPAYQALRDALDDDQLARVTGTVALLGFDELERRLMSFADQAEEILLDGSAVWLPRDLVERAAATRGITPPPGDVLFVRHRGVIEAALKLVREGVYKPSKS